MAKSKEEKEPKAKPVKKAEALTPEQIAKLPPATGPWMKPGQAVLEDGFYVVKDMYDLRGVAQYNAEEKLWWYRAMVRDISYFKWIARYIDPK